MRMTTTLGALIALLLTLACVFTATASADFGFTSAGTALEDPSGLPVRQAGAHPDFETKITFNQHVNALRNAVEPDGSVRDVRVDLPPGLVGNPQAVGTCTGDQLRPPSTGPPLCPLGSQIGTIGISTMPGPGAIRAGLYNMVPKPGEPAEFGFIFFGVPITIVPEIRPTDFGISALSVEASQSRPVYVLDVTLWGVPAAHAHDGLRAGADPSDPLGMTEVDALTVGPIAVQTTPRPFLSSPTACGAAEQLPLITADSWEHPDQSVSASGSLDGTPFLFSGCDQLGFTPTVSAQPLSHVADAPTGLDVDVKVPQSDNPNALATAHVRRVAIRFPVGMSVSPSSAAGLGACSLAQIGLGTNDAPTCPDSSKIGSVEVHTPLLADPLEGDVILAKQSDNPFGSLVALYMAIKGPGFYLKLPGRIDLDPATGQVTGTFDNTPQLPFSELHVRFRGGSQAPLSTPTVCGTYSSHIDVTSWASDTPVSSDDPMTVDEGCQPRVFSPSLSAGSMTPVAGQDTSFNLTLTRPGETQELAGLTVALPEGLLAHIGSVPECPEAQAAAGTCDPSSLVGHTSVLSGPGAAPLSLGGNVYLTGPYKGAPFGLSIVVPTAGQAGPFDLGNVVVRASLLVDRNDAHATVVSDPLPTIIQGIPLRLRQVTVSIDRPGFMVNPTSCNPLPIAAHVTSTQGTVADLANRFQLGGCSGLPFKPTFSASTVARTSRANGASLDAKIVIGVRGEANAHVVSVALPKQLPSRLTTIQKACLAAVFAVNPASCPAESLVGTASSKTEVLADPLSGPAYLVSHGGAAFPDLVVVLQGDGVRFDLVGAINISSKGITSTKFSNAPDAPIDTFELKLPQGPHSILTSNGSLCAKPLVMPTTLTAYNGKQVTQSTRIKVSGCPKAKKAKKHKVKKHKVKAKKGSAKAKAGAKR